ncbi:MAG TPA: ABC transporter substrate-binding protein [Candidatus Binatia bacterium]|nr:ABC transporter substrate-binding protein [Candidatus Binatia bacterium]
MTVVSGQLPVVSKKQECKTGTKTIFIWLLVTVLLLTISLAEGQQQAKILKIGYLSAQADVRGSRGGAHEVVRRELHAIGYVEGKNITFEYRYAGNKLDRLPTLANELARLNVDLILATSIPAALAAKNATKTIPVVFLGSGDPVTLGLVDSLARPGGNITGITSIAEVLAGKRLEILKETLPKLSRVAVFWDPKAPESVQQWKESQQSARELGLQLHSMEIGSADKLESAFHDATKARSVAVAGTHASLFTTNRKRIVDLAAKNRLPAIYSREDFVDSGGLMSYGADRTEPYTRAALMIDKILKGAKPSDLPVEQPTKFELVINLKTAKALGLTIPPIVMMRAERVVK